MPRPKKPTYEFVASRNEYRKRIKGPDGKRISIYAKTPEELTEKIAAVQREIEEDTYHRENPTVEEYATKWLTMHGSHIRTTTLVDYTSKVKIYIIEPLGKKYMAEVTPDDVKMAIGKATAQSASIYRGVQMLYKMIFGSAVESHIIDESPCNNLNPRGGKSPKEKKALTDEQVTVLLDAVRGLPPYPFIMLCLYAGLRREEALALQWDSLFLEDDAPHITVCRAWHVEHNRPVILTDLKTKAAKRTIPIPPQLVECLKAVKEKSTSDFVIANRDGGPLSETQWRRVWGYVRTRTVKERTYYRYVNGQKISHTVTPVLGERAAHNNDVVYSIDFEVTPHQLRHTYASLMITDGVPLIVVSRQLGHAQSSTTANIYAHAIASAQAKAMQTFDRFNDLVGQEQTAEQSPEGQKKRPMDSHLAAKMCIARYLLVGLDAKRTIKPDFTPIRKNEKSLVPVAAQGFSWSCYPDLNWGPHPYQRRGKNFYEQKKNKIS